MSLDVHMLTRRFLPLRTLGRSHETPCSKGVLNLVSVNFLKLYAINSILKHVFARGEGAGAAYGPDPSIEPQLSL